MKYKKFIEYIFCGLYRTYLMYVAIYKNMCISVYICIYIYIRGTIPITCVYIYIYLTYGICPCMCIYIGHSLVLVGGTF